MRNKNYRLVESTLKRQKLALQLISGERIERTEWFIHEQDRGIRGQRSGNSYTLSLPTQSWRG